MHLMRVRQLCEYENLINRMSCARTTRGTRVKIYLMCLGFELIPGVIKLSEII